MTWQESGHLGNGPGPANLLQCWFWASGWAFGLWLYVTVAPTRAEPPAKPPEPATELTSQQDRSEAILVLQRVVDGQSDAGEETPAEAQAAARVKLGRLLQGQGRLREADEVLQKLEGLTWQDQDGTRAWGSLTRGEIRIATDQPGAAVPLLERAIEEAGAEHPEPRNWARVRLAEALTRAWSLDRVVEVARSVAADHADGKADDEQAAWALFWSGRALTHGKELHKARGPLERAIALTTTKYPHIAYEAEFALAETYRLSGDDATALAHYRIALDHACAANLDEAKRNRARQQAGSEMRRLGSPEQGIALLRMGIEDPAHLRGTDHVLAEQIASFMTAEQAEAWHKYLLDPARRPDPTEPFVKTHFGTAPPPPSSPTVNNPFVRQYWLARLYRDQGRYAEAIAGFEQAQAAARTPRQRGTALSGLAQAYARQAGAMSQQRRKQELAQATELAKNTAHQAATVWTQVALKETGPNAHGATEEAVRAHTYVHQPTEALATADAIVQRLGDNAEPSKVAFARYMKMQALFWNGLLDEAVREALVLDQRYADSLDARVREVCGSALVRASAYYTRLGNPEAGLGLLDRVAKRYPNMDRPWTDRYRTSCEQAIADKGEASDE